jgi:16S rRNA U516 pseudouridylate synthase RsuA-like enzyme
MNPGVFIQMEGESRERFMARIGQWMDILAPIGGEVLSVGRFDESSEGLLVVSIFTVKPTPEEET